MGEGAVRLGPCRSISVRQSSAKGSRPVARATRVDRHTGFGPVPPASPRGGRDLRPAIAWSRLPAAQKAPHQTSKCRGATRVRSRPSRTACRSIGGPRLRPPASSGQVPVAWWASTPDVAIAELGSDASLGLTSAAAAARRAADGPNELVEAASKPAWRLFLGQFANTMIIVLLGAGLVTALIGDLTDAAVIAAVVVLNALIGFGQEHRAERAMAALRRMTQPLARVVRDGVVRTVPAADIVRGDILHLDAGDLVAADATADRRTEPPGQRGSTHRRVRSGREDRRRPGTGEGRLVADRRNMVFRGTAIAYGRGRVGGDRHRNADRPGRDRRPPAVPRGPADPAAAAARGARQVDRNRGRRDLRDRLRLRRRARRTDRASCSSPPSASPSRRSPSRCRRSSRSRWLSEPTAWRSSTS